MSGYRSATEYALLRSAGVLDLSVNDKRIEAVHLRLFGGVVEPPLMRLWGAFKALAVTVLLFLVALGLRNNYRLK